MARSDADAKLRPQQVLALAALIGTGDVDQAAAAARVSPSTLRRWLAGDSQFTAAMRAESRRAASRAVSQLLAAQTEAVECLRAAMRTGTPAVRVRAARAVLEVGARTAADDLDLRLDELERRTEGWTDGETSGREPTRLATA